MSLEIMKERVLLDGKDYYIASGEMHYFRIMPGAWKRHLTLLRDFGLNTVQTYVPWHQHEPKKGQFDFEGHLNMAAFLKLCGEMDIKVLLRPSPYITSELDLGGVPAWIMENPETEIRKTDPYYFACIESYYKRLCKEFVPYLSTNGGPVIAVAIENEYGSYCNDKNYLSFLRDTLMNNGVNVPFFTTDGGRIISLSSGSLENTWTMVNCGKDVETAIPSLQTFAPDQKPMIGEFWCGRHEVYGGTNVPRDVDEVATLYEKALQMGAFVNFYMFSGGTNFGFTSGIHYGIPYHVPRPAPLRMFVYATSYNCDALVTEWGDTTPKYYALRKVLDKFLGKKERDNIIPNLPKQAISNVEIKPYASLLENKSTFAEKSVTSVMPKTMENLGQTFGYILYSTQIPPYPQSFSSSLFIDGLHDLALIYVDGKYVDTYLRDEGESGKIKIEIPQNGCRLDIIVENMGRPDAGKYVTERKGITGGVNIGGVHLVNWETWTFPMDTMPNTLTTEIKKTDGPVFYKGTFKAQKGIDTFLDTRSLQKGFVCINGFNIGRYWNTCPIRTLFVPGDIVKEENEIIIFDLYGAGDSVQFLDTPIMDELDTNNPFIEKLDKMQ